jgi:hypothetical protein
MEQIKLDKATHIYEPNLPSVTTILQACGLIDTTWFTDEARDRGSRIHQLSEDYDRGQLDWSAVTDEDLGYVQSFAQFRINHQDLVWDWIEVPMMDSLGLYAGTSDRMICQRPKHIWDLKTGVHYDWHRIQLAAYANMDGDPYSWERHCIYLDREGKTPKVLTYTKAELKEDLEDWNSALRIYYRQRKGRK